MATDASTSRADRGFANILRNLAWLVGGKGFGALCSLVYLAVLSRSLGLKDFGHFSLIFGTGQALVAIASFQTWQTIVKFGADPVHRGEWAKFGRLAWLCGSIDVAGATLCPLPTGIRLGRGWAGAAHGVIDRDGELVLVLSLARLIPRASVLAAA